MAIYIYTVSRSSFGTGYIFGYWSSWKKDAALQDSFYKKASQGCKQSDLYVAPFFAKHTFYE